MPSANHFGAGGFSSGSFPSHERYRRASAGNNIVPVILCGGSGTRLWPLSRAGFPKQFLVLSGTTSLFQQAIERVNGLAAADISVGQTLVVTNEEHRFLALDQIA